MTTCLLCGQRDHAGPCYSDLRDQWAAEERERWITLHGFQMLKKESGRWAWKVVVLDHNKNAA